MVYLGTSITAGSRNSVDIENGSSNGHNDLNRSNDNDSSGDEEGEGQIRVGKDYQVSPPNWIPPERKII